MKKLSSNIKIIMSIILIIIFVFCFFTITLTSKITHQKILTKNEIKTNANIASSYINMKLKQNDKSENIYTKKNPNTNKNALVILDDCDNPLTNTWIYFDRGFLWENKSLKNSPPNQKNATKIASIDGFNIQKDNQKIIYEISYIYNSTPYTDEYVVILRSA